MDVFASRRRTGLRQPGSKREQSITHLVQCCGFAHHHVVRRRNTCNGLGEGGSV
jgi:hypothetical protein